MKTLRQSQNNKTQRGGRPTRFLFLTTALLALLVAGLLACGPADESVQRDMGNMPQTARQTLPTSIPEAPMAAPQDNEPTPEPEPTPGNYPNLEDTLADLVRKYETKELTEEQAAALSREHHGNMVLVEVQVVDGGIPPVDAWMGKKAINPRYADSGYDPDHIYAYARVSLLGALSGRTGVTQVLAPNHWFDENAIIRHPGEDTIVRGADAGPELPWWLEDYDASYEYAKITGNLNHAYLTYLRGELDQATKDRWKGCTISRSNDNWFNFRLAFDPAVTTAAPLMDWIRANDGGVETNAPTFTGGGEVPHEYFFGAIAFANLLALSERNGVLYLSADCNVKFNSQPLKPAGQTANPNEAVALHGVQAWLTGATSWTGDRIKVGVIDEGFTNLGRLMQSGDVPNNTPGSTRVFGQCYVDDSNQIPNADIRICQRNELHGTAVVEALADMAPGIDLYIANSTVGTMGVKERIDRDVRWMKRNGVHIINYSGVWSFLESPGNGDFYTDEASPPVLASVQYAVGPQGGKGALWVNAAGNEGVGSFHSETTSATSPAFLDKNNNNRHEYDNAGDEKNYLEDSSGNFWRLQSDITVFLRWKAKRVSKKLGSGPGGVASTRS